MASATIILKEDELDLIAFVYVCDTCAVSATIHPSFFADSGTPICGNPDCEGEGDDMTMVMASVSVTS